MKKDGGHAFPETHVYPKDSDNPGWMGCSGMSLRDYLAAKVITGCRHEIPEQIAAYAYRVADAILAEKDK